MPGNVIVSPPGPITVHDCWVVRVISSRETWRQPAEVCHSRHAHRDLRRLFGPTIWPIGYSPAERNRGRA